MKTDIVINLNYWPLPILGPALAQLYLKVQVFHLAKYQIKTFMEGIMTQRNGDATADIC